MVSLASLFTLQLRAADSQVLLLEPTAGSTAARTALAPGHQQGWTDCGTAAPSPAQGQPHTAPTPQPGTQDRQHVRREMCSYNPPDSKSWVRPPFLWGNTGTRHLMAS